MSTAFDITSATRAFAALGHEGRLAVFRLLVRYAPHPVRPTEIAAALGLKPNTLSHYLSDLADAGLIHATREGRSLLYAVDMSACSGLNSFLVEDCCRSRPLGDAAPRTAPYRVLFLCSANSARSIMAEAILRAQGTDFIAYSAGTRPAGQVHPMARETLRRHGLDTPDLYSKDIASLADTRFDFVFTLCDTAAAEECAPFAAQPVSAHWSLPDPAKAEGAGQALAFAETYQNLHRRITAFAALPLADLGRMALQARVDDIGLS